MTTTNTTTPVSLSWALHLAGRGWAVFPLVPGGKTPAGHPAKHCRGTGDCAAGHRTWEQRATTDPDQIRAWWAAAPTANIGIACGRSGLYVIDCDTVKPDEAMPAGHPAGRVDSGLQVLRALAARHDTVLAPTFAVQTASGGWHLYYTQPAGEALRNTAKTLGWKLDTRGHGGYVVGPGSLLPHGGYELYDERDPAPLPNWLHRLLTVRPTPATAPSPAKAPVRLSRYVEAALVAETANVVAAPDGQRNYILARSSFALGQLVGAGVLDEHVAREAMERARSTWTPAGSDAKDLGPGGVIDTSLTNGAACPRRITGRKDTA